jgi:hypothetical protein
MPPAAPKTVTLEAYNHLHQPLLLQLNPLAMPAVQPRPSSSGLPAAAFQWHSDPYLAGRHREGTALRLGKHLSCREHCDVAKASGDGNGAGPGMGGGEGECEDIRIGCRERVF